MSKGHSEPPKDNAILKSLSILSFYDYANDVQIQSIVFQSNIG